MSSETDSARSPNFVDVAVAGLLSNDRILLVRTRRLPEHWQPPGGKVEGTDQSPVAALQRELHEELGLHIDPTTLHAFAEEPSDVGLGRVHFFIARLPMRVELRVQQNEILDYQWWRLDEALSLPAKPATKHFLQRLTQARS